MANPFQWLRQKLGQVKAPDDPLLASIAEQVSEIYAKLEIHKDIERPAVIALSEMMTARLNAIWSASDRVHECRHQLVICTDEYSRHLVLTMQPAPEPDFSCLRGTQGVSGELHSHLLRIVQVDQTLKEAVGEWASDRAFMHKMVGLLARRGAWFAYSMNACRKMIGDMPPDGSDWFGELVHSRCVWWESKFRKLLDLPPAIAGDEYQIVAMAYLGFSNVAEAGSSNPVAEWKSKLRNMIDDGTLKPL